MGTARDRFWDGKCVVITGASSGIGSAFARFIDERGAKVGLIARREAALANLAQELRNPAAVAAADVRDCPAIVAAVQAIEARLGPCDVALACAGIYRKTSGTSFQADVVDEVFATNVNGVTHLAEAVLPGMIARRSGHFAAVASVAALVGLPGAAAYSASKSAVVRMLQSLRVDLHASGIRVTAVCPGFVDTAMITDEERRTLKHLVSAPEAARHIANAIASGKAEHWFPWQTWLEAKLASLLPPRAYRLAVHYFGEMEET